jgi:hypothetical protein
MNLRTTSLSLIGPAIAAGALALAHGCSATSNNSELPTGGSTATAGGSGGAGGTLFVGGSGGEIFTGGSGGGTAGSGGSIVDPCVAACGNAELCDGIHAGIDDDCNGVVDEDCPCVSGMVESCFKGNPAYLNEPGCHPGTQKCTEFGYWDECAGGVHATEGCYEVQVGCHALTAYPFETVNLKDGTGAFSDGATTETWTVVCPLGVDPGPGVTGSSPADDFQPLQSGEYTVHYTRQPPTQDNETACEYPLFVGAPGFRVELEWEHGVLGPSDTGVDLDLHVHKPQDTTPWEGDGGSLVDCAWNNCVYNDFFPTQGANAPSWFAPPPAQPPDPVNWYLDPVLQKNTCYFAPRGVGAYWSANGQGCHNPRLDLDNITCNPASVDVNDTQFCAPENINIDYPPKNQWIRIGVHYYSNHGVNYDVHPRIRIFCNAAQVAELGPQGYNTPVTFTPADGESPSTNLFWLVADVLFLNDPCVEQRCQVETLYYDKDLQTALLTTVPMVQASYGPQYPPIPQP